MKITKLTFAAMAALVIAGFAVSPGLTAEEKGGFVPPREKIEKPYTNDKCLKNCHGEKTLKAGGPDGAKRDLFVDLDGYFESTHGQRGLWCIDCHYGADPNFHPREGYPKADCRACHSARPPEGVYPPNAKAIFAEREIKPPAEKKLKGDSWNGSAHGKAWVDGKPNAPFCSGCHTAHYVRKTIDPASAVYSCNLPKTCGKCHNDQTDSVDVGGALARWSIAGHGKGDFSQVYSEKACLACHQGQAAHGEETVTGQACPSCHRPKEKIEAGKKSFHLAVGEGAGCENLALRYLYDVLFWGAVAGLGLVALFFGFSSIFAKSGREGE